MWRILHLLYILCNALIFIKVGQVCYPEHGPGIQSWKELQPYFCTHVSAPQRHSGGTDAVPPGCPFLREEDRGHEILRVFPATAAFSLIHMKFWMQQMSSEVVEGGNCIFCGMDSNRHNICECRNPI